MEIVNSLLGQVVELLAKPIRRPFNYSSNIQNLKNLVEELSDRKTRVLRDIEEARRRGEEIEPDVEKWLASVNAITEEACKVFEHAEDRGQKRSFTGLYPELVKRYKLSTEAENKAEEAVQLKLRGNFDRVSYLPISLGIGDRYLKNYEAFESRTPILNEIMTALKDADVDLIGVYGMAGVGKTTLVRKVAEQVKADRVFDVVVLAVISQTPNLTKVQEEIADGLHFKLDSDTIDRRADQLRKRLKKEKKILVILDDIWERLELEDVGIPSGNAHVGCKILMTSRNRNVLSREMDAKLHFPLQVLSSDEAWNLFVKVVGDDVKSHNTQSVATEVAKRCAGLPILLVTVATALKNAEVSEWKDALRQLKRFDSAEMAAQVYSLLELSYNSLKSDEIKSLFLLCGQLKPNNILIVDLLMYAMGLGLFTHCDTLEEVRHRLYKLINDLKASCFLLEGETDEIVKMHDVIHDFAMSIASRDHQIFTIASGTALQEWPPKGILEQCTAISFPYGKIPRLPEVFECPNVESFILCVEDSMLQIPDNLFSRMRKLKVMDLTDVHLPTLPSSIQFLENLQMLCLYRCVLENIAVIGELKNLQVLSFAGSNIVQLSVEIQRLSRLRLLDLSDCTKLEVIPPNVLSCFTQLEDLYMENSFEKWEVEGLNNLRQNANLAELKHLPNLITLDIHILDIEILPKDLFFRKLERFKIFIGDNWDWSGKYETSTTLKLKLNKSIPLEEGVKVLLKRAEDLYLNEVKDIKNIVYELDEQGFPQLKHLHVLDSSELQHMIDSVMMDPYIAFPRLELLSLDNLTNLEKICHGQLIAESLRNLRILKVEGCHKLKNLFSFSMAKGILQLEEINAVDCKIMEEIVVDEIEDDSENNEAIELSQLRVLTLECLPQFRSICSKVIVPSTDASLQQLVSINEPATTLFNEKILFPNLEDLKLSSVKVEKIWHDLLVDLSSSFQRLTSLTVQGCENMKYLFTSSMVKGLLQLRKLQVCECKLMEEIVSLKKLGGEVENEILFPKLDFLKLKGLPKLARFSASNLIICPSLKQLLIENCPEMKTFVSNNCASMHVAASREFEETNLTLFDEKVLFPNLEELRIFYMDNVKMIWPNELHPDSFFKLKLLKVEHLKNLLHIFPPSMPGRFHNLESLVLHDCHSLEEVFDLQTLVTLKEAQATKAIQLKTIHIDKLPNLKNVWNKNPQGFLSYQNLRSMIVFECPNLKSIFPVSIARGLLQLEKLKILSCGVEEIIAKEEGVESASRFVFPAVTSLTLWVLPELKTFYPGVHTSEWTVLKKLKMFHCDQMLIYDSKFRAFQGSCMEDELHIPQPLFSLRKIIPRLQRLTLSSEDTAMIWQCQFQADFFQNVKVLELQCFHDGSETFPVHLLQRMKNMVKLVVRHSHFKELFPLGLLDDMDYVMTPLPIRSLNLYFLPDLEHIWHKDLPLDLLLNLETLKVWNCGSLINVAPSTTSFQKLTVMHVWECKALIYLIASRTARSLVQLTTLSVTDCDMVTGIVAEEGEEAEYEIIFSKLEKLELVCLTNLKSFCSTKFTFKFPSLTEVIVSQCPNMNVFSHGVLSTPKLRKVWVSFEKDKGHWKGDLNNTIKLLNAQDFEE